MSLGGLPGSLRLNVSDVSVSQGPAPPLSHSLPVTMSQMSQCLGALCLTASPSQCLNVSMSQGGSAWASVAMSQCLNVSGGLPGPARSVSTSQCLSCFGGVCLGQHGASQRLNVSVVSAGSAWASSALSMSQCLSCLREGLPGPARRVSMSQCLSVSGRSAWGRPGPAQPRLNVSVPQGGLLGGDQDQRSRVSQCLRCLPVSGSLSPLSRRRASASIQSVGEHPERRRAASRTLASIQSVGEHPEHRRVSTASASIKVGFGLGCGKATQKKLDRPYLNRARHPSRRNSPLNTLRAQGGCRAA